MSLAEVAVFGELIEVTPSADSLAAKSLRESFVFGNTWYRDSVTIPEGVESISVAVANYFADLGHDSDLYVRKGSEPTTTEYDCISNSSVGIAELCTLPVSENEVLHIGVFANSDSIVNVIIGAEALGSAEVEIGQSVAGSVLSGEMAVYSVPVSGSERVFALVGDISADVDLYVDFGEAPTTGRYYCKSEQAGLLAESCELYEGVEDTIFLGVYGRSASSFRLVVGGQ